MSKPIHLRSSLPNDPTMRHTLIGATTAVALTGLAAALYQAYKYYSPRRAHYKLTYFNSRGIAEPIRFIFALADVKYEDHRYPDSPTEMIGGVDRPVEFIQAKESYPFAQVPVLEVNGIVMAQSKAIERYLAKQFGFLGNNDIEAQLIDSAVEHLNDLMIAYQQARKTDSRSSSAPQSTTEVDQFFSGTLSTGLRYLNRFAVAHGTASNHSTLVGSSLSLVDIFLFYFLSMFPNQTTIVHICTAYPNLRAVREAVSNRPEIKNWIRNRPATEK